MHGEEVGAACVAGETATGRYGTHPTGMHSRYEYFHTRCEAIEA